MRPSSTEPGYGTLRVTARLAHAAGSGMIYAIALDEESGRRLLDGHAMIALPQEGS